MLDVGIHLENISVQNEYFNLTVEWKNGEVVEYGEFDTSKEVIELAERLVQHENAVQAEVTWIRNLSIPWATITRGRVEWAKSD